MEKVKNPLDNCISEFCIHISCWTHILFIFYDKNLLNRSNEFASPKSLGKLQSPPSYIDGLDPNDPKSKFTFYNEELSSKSNTVIPEYVGNELSCVSCHANHRAAQQNSMIGDTKPPSVQ